MFFEPAYQAWYIICTDGRLRPSFHGDRAFCEFKSRLSQGEYMFIPRNFKYRDGLELCDKIRRLEPIHARHLISVQLFGMITFQRRQIVK